MSSKPRPDNGPGSNGLRGGIKVYSAKTTTGQWQEEYGGPALYKRGFTTTDFQTEAQYAQLGVVRKSVPLFGSGLPLTEVVRHKATTAELFNPTNTQIDSQWKTNSHIMNSTVNKRETIEDTMLVPILPRTKLEEYRKHWTCDTDVGRKFRFQTESRIAGNAANDKFQVNSLRLLPGSPKSLEAFRARVMERYGLFGLSALKHCLGSDSTLSSDQLKQRLQRSCGVEIKSYELSQILAFITASPSVVQCDDFLRAMRGKVDGFNASLVKGVFERIAGDNGDAIDTLSVVAALDTQDHPELRDGFEQFLPAYSSRGGDIITCAEFVEFHQDMYLSSPGSFNATVKSIWQQQLN